jgi:uncharacterized protein
MREQERPLVGWIAVASALAVLNYSSRAAAGKAPKDELYTWSLAISSVVLFGIVLAIVLLLARHDLRGLLALRRPRSWPQAAGLAALLILGISVLSAALEPVLHAGREQGLTTSHWRPDRAGEFAANAILIVLVAPVVEELLFRGLGYSVLRPFGRWTAIILVGVAFGLAHGLVYGLPILVLFGIGLAYLRDRTDSVYPGIALHASYNAVALFLSLLS